jgi:uncharacterized membrane protein
MEVVRGIALVAATISIGLMAGVFFAYAVAVMPGLARTDNRTFIGAFQAIDRAIINPIFLTVFVGAFLLSVLAGLLHLGTDNQSALLWVAAAAVLYLITFIITVRINIPRNDAMKAAGDPHLIDVVTVREQFDETTWARWNVVRTVLTTAAFGSMIGALVAYGGTT